MERIIGIFKSILSKFFKVLASIIKLAYDGIVEEIEKSQSKIEMYEKRHANKTPKQLEQIFLDESRSSHERRAAENLLYDMEN